MKETILLPIGGQYPRDAVVQCEDGTCYPIGGGFAFKLRAGAPYRPVTKEDCERICLRPALFSIEGSDELYAGYTTGRRWNGWECPLFTEEVARKILEDACLKYDYFAAPDKFRVLNEWGDPEEPYDFAQGQTHVVDSGQVRLYPIMDGWCWSEETPAQDEAQDEEDAE